MVDASRPQAALGDFEAAAFAEQNVAGRHAHVVEAHLHVAVRCVVVAHHIERADHLQTRGAGWHQHHALLGVAGRIRVGLAHGDVDGATRIAGARCPPLAAVDHVVIAIAFDARGDVGGIAGGDIGLGHGEGRADLALKQGFEPARLVLF